MARTFATPLRRAKGAGSSHEGVGHFRSQRLTAIASIVMAILALLVAIFVGGRDYAEARQLLAHPIIAGTMALAVGVFVWHMIIGMQVIIEDYVHNPVIKLSLLIANLLFGLLVFALAAVSIAVIAVGHVPSGA